jgi:hypothetical protein
MSRRRLRSTTLCQPPFKGGRQPVHSAFLPQVERAVEREMSRWGVSRAFVIATAVAYALGVKEQPDYRTLQEE